MILEWDGDFGGTMNLTVVDIVIGMGGRVIEILGCMGSIEGLDEEGDEDDDGEGWSEGTDGMLDRMEAREEDDLVVHDGG